MANKFIRDGMVMFGGETTATDDVAVLANLISQLEDLLAISNKQLCEAIGLTGEDVKCPEATAYDEYNKMDWGTDDVMAYMRNKYGKEI